MASAKQSQQIALTPLAWFDQSLAVGGAFDAFAALGFVGRAAVPEVVRPPAPTLPLRPDGMIELKLPFWLDGPELAKLRAAAQYWWQLAEGWLRWPLGQFDALTAHLAMVDLMAYQRDIQRFKDEPELLYRKRVKYALVNAQDAGSKAGFIRIFERLGIGYVEIYERVDVVNWDVIKLRLSSGQIAQNQDLLRNIVQQYGRTCRRYEFETITPIGIQVPTWGVGHTWGYSVAKI